MERRALLRRHALGFIKALVLPMALAGTARAEDIVIHPGEGIEVGDSRVMCQPQHDNQPNQPNMPNQPDTGPWGPFCSDAGVPEAKEVCRRRAPGENHAAECLSYVSAYRYFFVPAVDYCRREPVWSNVYQCLQAIAARKLTEQDIAYCRTRGSWYHINACLASSGRFTYCPPWD